MFVTNDTVPNFLFKNNGDGTFSEDALMSGVSVTGSGRPISSMGADAEDYDNDGCPDIRADRARRRNVPALSQRLARRLRRRDAGERPRPCSRVKLSGWCSIVADMNNDGWKDIFTANSHVNARIGDFQAIAFKQPNSAVRQRRTRTLPRCV